MSTTPQTQPAPPIGDDLIWGAQAIADELGIPIDRVYYFVRKKKIPAAKLGPKTIVASRKALRRALTTVIAD
jgi:hypothetical protein